MGLFLPPRYPLPGVTVGTATVEGGVQGLLGTSNTPASGNIGTANRAVFIPLNLLDPFLVAKAFWCNGTTASTDSVDIGVYNMTDISTGRLDLIRSTGAVLASGASVVQDTATFRTARANLTASSSSTDAATYALASVTLKAGRLYLLSVENSHGSSASAVSAITGGPTFTSRSTTQYNGTLNRTSIWSAVPTADFTGVLTIAFGGTTQTGACWSLEEFAGVDTSSNDGIVQQAVGTGNSATALATLAAFGSANNATFGAHGHAAATATAPGAGFTETADVTTATPAQALETAWNVGNDTTVDATFTSAQWGSCAVEIKADASAFVIPPGRTYLAIGATGTTTTFLNSSPGGPRVMAGGGLIASSALPLLSSVIGAVGNQSVIPICGFSSRTLLG